MQSSSSVPPAKTSENRNNPPLDIPPPNNNSFTMTASGKFRKRSRSVKRISEEFSSCDDLCSLSSTPPAPVSYGRGSSSLTKGGAEHTTTDETSPFVIPVQTKKHLPIAFWGWFVDGE